MISLGIWSGPGAFPTISELIISRMRVGGIGGVESLAHVDGKANLGSVKLSGLLGSVQGYESSVCAGGESSEVKCLVTSEMTSVGSDVGVPLGRLIA